MQGHSHVFARCIACCIFYLQTLFHYHHGCICKYCSSTWTTWAHIIKKDQFTMASVFRLLEVGILSGWSILLRRYFRGICGLKPQVANREGSLHALPTPRAAVWMGIRSMIEKDRINMSLACQKREMS